MKLMQKQNFLKNIILLKNYLKINVCCEHNGPKILSLNIHGENHEYPYLWLRDNCQCEKCFHSSSQSRIVNWYNFNVNVTPICVEKNTNTIKISWSDGHISEYQHEWLHYRSFNEKERKDYTESMYRPKKETWNSKSFENVCQTFNFNSILNSDKHLYNWLDHFSRFGVNLIDDVPASDSSLDKLIDKIGFAKKTHYGEKFAVENKTGANNVAYLSSELQLHVDLPYYHYCPGATLLHCVVQTEDVGGNSLLVDCLHIGNLMMKIFPKEYKILSTVEVEWCDIGQEFGKDFHSLYRAPVICEDNAEIIKINSSIPQRSSYFPTYINNVEPWYKAYKLFIDLCYHNKATFKLRTGQILAFDNLRLMHGRKAYKDSENNVRKLIGVYIDWDEIYSKLRCLKSKLNK